MNLFDMSYVEDSYLNLKITSELALNNRKVLLLVDSRSNDFAKTCYESDFSVKLIKTDFENPLFSLERLINEIEQETIHDSSILIVSMLGFDLTIDNGFNYSVASSYISFFGLMFKKLIDLKKDIEIIGIGHLTSSCISLFEGVAFSAVYEASQIKSCSLKIDKVYSFKEILTFKNQCFNSKKGLRFIFSNGVLKVQKPLLVDSFDSSLKGMPFFQSNGVYVLLGGNGGIGQLLSKYLVDEYNAKVIIAARSNLDQFQVEKLKKLGVASYFRLDISNYKALEETLIYVNDYYDRIDGVFHLAGNINDRLLRNFDISTVDNVLKPKIQGALNLEKVSQKIDLGLVCFFSSLSAIIGNIGQSVYASANAFIDDFCMHMRKNRRSKWVSINWGAWESEGMQINPLSSDLIPLKVDDAFEGLSIALSNVEKQYAIFAGKIELFGKDEISYHENNLKEESFQKEKMKSDDSYLIIEKWLYDNVKKFSGITNLDPNQSFIDSGIDSVGIINIAYSIENFIQKYVPEYKLNKSVLFDYSTVNKLSIYLLESSPFATNKEILIGLTNITKPYDTGNISKKEDDDKLINTATTNEKQEPLLDEDNQNYSKNDQHIAIIGIAGEFPGADSIDELEKILIDKKCTVKQVPTSRWDWKKYYSSDINCSTKGYCRHGGFINKAAEFDPVFFNISPSESIKIDPQERRFLQMAYHVLEDSGHFSNSRHDVGVFVAAMFNHYQNLDNDKLPSINSSFSSIANRVSYHFDFNGPSFCLDSMCSGSLTALHLAIQSINNNECSKAIVGGVNIMPHPEKYNILSKAGFLSPSGKCQSFGVDADGYIPGEGVVAIVVKKLSDAIKDNDRIYGVIRGCSINSVGKSSGYNVPSSKSQAMVIKQALKKAEVPSEKISYIEAHGTGTRLGDPIEIAGLKDGHLSTFSENLTCWVGSIKSNIGHLESAAGLAGLIKILLQFKNKKIFPSLFSQIENPDLGIVGSKFKIAKDLLPWDTVNKRYAGVSSFGAGGSNAHVILEEFHSHSQRDNIEQERYIIPISAKSLNSLEKRIDDLLQFLQNFPDERLYSLAYTLACTREHFSYRCCFIVSDKEDFIKALIEKKGNYKADNLIDESIIDELTIAYKRYLSGENVNFSQFFSIKSITSLPFYPFESNKYWLDFANVNESAKIEPKKAYLDNKGLFLSPTYNRIFEISENTSNEYDDKILTIYVNALNEDVDRVEKNQQIYFVFEGSDLAFDKKRVALNYDKEEQWDNFFSKIRKEKKLDGLKIVIFPLKEERCEPEKLVYRYFYMAKALVNIELPIHFIVIAKKNNVSKLDKMHHSLHGLFRTLSIEKNKTTSTLIEIDSKELSRAFPISLSVGKFAKDHEFGRFFVSNNVVYQYELKELLLDDKNQRIRKNGVYLITGGLGEVGKVISKFLLEKYSAKLILVGRSKISQQSLRQHFEEQYLGEIEYYSADITDIDQVQRIIDKSVEKFGSINGIIHSAGIISDGLFINKKPDDFVKTIMVKAKGVENLDYCTREIPLDFFTCFSSLSSINGNVGQSDYVVANNYLDLFASMRNNDVLKGKGSGTTLSINWPLWSSYDDRYNMLNNYLRETYGIESLPNDIGALLWEFMVNRVSSDMSQVIPLLGSHKIIKEKFLKKFQIKQTGNISDLNKKEQPDNDVDHVDEHLSTDMTVQRGLNHHINDISDIVKNVTGRSDVILDQDVSFGDLGLNSIMLQQLAKELSIQYQISIPPLVLFKYNSINKTINYIQSKIVKKNISVSSDIEEKGSKLNNKNNKSSLKIAIIGINGIMPGSRNLDEYWQNLIENKNLISKVSRWKDKEYFAGTIPDYDHFDPNFFNMSIREAVLLDPQQRLFLQTSYNTILDAGYRPSELSNVGVFVGAQFNDYKNLLAKAGIMNHPFSATGNSNSMIANRVSYFFNFTGPSQTIDTACSSAVVAINRAIDCLHKKECDYAIAGAVSLLLDPKTTEAAISMGVLSNQYRCATFDDSADGYVRGEGVGAVLLKRYDDAIADGDSIYGIIESIKESHGGRANSITAPNQKSQADLIISAYKDGIANNVSYIETHGTGTRLGDPIEIEALKDAWGELTVNNAIKTVYLGAVKTSIGHLEPAAGMASLFKVLLSIKNKQLPANLNFSKLNSYIDFSSTPFKLLTQNIAWNDTKPLVAGMSCFGFGGSNTHMVISEHIPNQSSLIDVKRNETFIFTLSSKSKKSLSVMGGDLLDYLKSTDVNENILSNMSFTLNTGRDHFEYRIAVLAKNKDELIQQIDSIDYLTIPKIKLKKSIYTLHKQNLSDDLFLLKEAYLEGALLDWNKLYQGKTNQRLHLPGYFFDTRRCWFEEVVNER